MPLPVPATCSGSCTWTSACPSTHRPAHRAGHLATRNRLIQAGVPLDHHQGAAHGTAAAIPALQDDGGRAAERTPRPKSWPDPGGFGGQVGVPEPRGADRAVPDPFGGVNHVRRWGSSACVMRRSSPRRCGRSPGARRSGSRSQSGSCPTRPGDHRYRHCAGSQSRPRSRPKTGKDRRLGIARFLPRKDSELQF